MGVFNGYLLVSDMDGTLLNSNGRLSKENIAAIEYFVDNGGKFTLATGRMLPSVKRHIEKIKVNLPVIMYNGTKVYDYNTNEVIWERQLEEYKKEIVRKMKDINSKVGIEIYSEEVVYVFQSCRQTERFKNLGYNVVYEIDDSIWQKKWTKVLIVGDKEELDSFEECFSERYSEVSLVRSADIFLEMIPEGVSKGQALKELMQLNNIEDHTTITIGDNMNDLELLQEADYGFCTGNGSAQLRNKAKYIACSNDDHVIEFIINWIKDNFVNKYN